MQDRDRYRRTPILGRSAAGWWLLLLGALALPAAAAAQSLFDRGGALASGLRSTEVATRLVADTTAIQPGVPFRLGVLFTPEPDWHIYWRYPGEVGLPTRVEWVLPEGFTAGDLQWPNPEPIDDPATGLKSYGWGGEVLLFATITPPAELEPGAEFRLGAKSSWLACKIQCVPGSAQDFLSLPANDAGPSADAAIFLRFEPRVPLAPDSAGLPLSVRFAPETANLAPGSKLEQKVEVEANGEWRLLIATESEEAAFFPDVSPDLKTSHPQLTGGSGESEQVGGNLAYRSMTFDWTLEAFEDAAAGATGLRPALTLPATNLESGEQRTFRLLVAREVLIDEAAEGPTSAGASAVPGAGKTVAPKAPDEAPTTATAAESGFAFKVERQESRVSTLTLLLYALLGGLLLNVMPCVLPVLSIKVLGFVNQAREESKRVFRSGLVFAAGVYVSFLLLAGLVIAVKLAGAQIGWGFQLQEPRFVVLIAAAIFAFGLSLFGVFAIELPGMAAGPMHGAASWRGHGGDFMNGVLATALATPCTAPLLGPALGFAFVQPPPMILLFFVVIATGLALPYVLLAARPGWLRFVPKPGVWMERFKQSMGVLLMGTVIWLLSVLGSQAGADGIVAAAWFLLAVGVASGLIGWGFDLGAALPRRGTALLLAFALVLGAYFYFPERHLQALAAAGGPPAGAAGAKSLPSSADAGGIDWQPFSVEAVNALVAENKTVFVDFTADWCLTCKVNERTVLSTDRVAAAFRQYEVKALLADYTRRQPEITRILNQFGRAGVPMYLIFPAGRPEEYILLPEVLTTQMVVDALAEASRPKAVADAR